MSSQFMGGLRREGRWLVAAGGVLVVGLPAVAADRAFHAAPPSCPGSTPSAIVQSFYAAAGRGDVARAEACLTPAYRAKMYGLNTLPDYRNVASLRVLHIEDHPMDPRVVSQIVSPLPVEVDQVYVQFNAQWKTFLAERDVTASRFIYVVKEESGTPWRIASIGTGP